MTSSGGLASVGERPAPRISSATATWIVQKGSNDTWFRCDAPAEVVGGKVNYVNEKNIDRATTYPNNNTGLPWTAFLETPAGLIEINTKGGWAEATKAHHVYTDMDVIFPTVEGTAIFTRPCGRRAILAQFMRNQGQLTVAETDDNYMADSHWNLHQRQVGWNEQAKDVVLRSMASFDRNVYSTVWLRDRYHKEMKRRLGKQGLPELFVCRNHVPRWAWPDRQEYDGPVRVGFMGSGSHVWDINMAYTAIHAAKTYGEATTTMIGYNPAVPDDEPDEWTINDVTYQMRSDKSKMFRDKWAAIVDTHIRWIDPGDYRRVPLPLDIGIAPLARADDFTLGKSDAKALEYTIAGAACVFSGAGIYDAGGWKHEENCLIAGSQQEMAEATLRLCLDEKLRYELVTAAQEMVWNDRSEDQMKEEWGAALGL